MDKNELIHLLYLVIALLAAWGGYIVGISSGIPA
jgi:hypothetical protein